MENLINFDESENNNNVSSNLPRKQRSPALNHPLLVNDRLSLDLNNPFDKLEYRITHSGDPFECLEVNQMKRAAAKEESKMNVENNLNGTLENGHSRELAEENATKVQNNANNSAISTSSSVGSKSQVVRCQSDSSTISSNDGNMSRFNSVDNILAKKSNQLLKLSLLNSPNSPLHSPCFSNSSPMADSVYLEARKISEQLKLNDISFEDLNNISQQLIDTSNLSANDGDLAQLRISFLDKNPAEPSAVKEDDKDSIKNKIVSLQEHLKKMKKEEPTEPKLEAKVEAVSPNQADDKAKIKMDVELNRVLESIQSLMNAGKVDEAKKQLKHLKMVPSSSSSSDSSHLQVAQQQPYVRQDTFEIDQNTGTRRYSSSNNNNNHHNSSGSECDSGNSSVSNEVMEQLIKLLNAQSLDVSSLNLSGSNNNVVLIVPKMPSPSATPVKQNNTARRSVSFSTKRPAVTQGIENKKLSTPMKHTASHSASVTRRSSFTAPRSITKPSHPLDQKANFGGVRKSLMGSIDKSPMKMKSPKKSIPAPPPSRMSSIRRSVSLKSTAPPSVTVSQATPKKAQLSATSATPSKNKTQPSATRMPSTPTPCRRLSTAHASTRPLTTATTTNVGQRFSMSANTASKRPVTTSQKTEFKTPYGTASKPSNAKGSLV